MSDAWEEDLSPVFHLPCGTLSKRRSPFGA
jgi:hypothetical protein